MSGPDFLGARIALLGKQSPSSGGEPQRKQVHPSGRESRAVLKDPALQVDETEGVKAPGPLPESGANRRDRSLCKSPRARPSPFTSA